MKLGIWNRLAVVATSLAALIAPTWIWLDIAGDIDENRRNWHRICLELADHEKAVQDAVAARERCLADALRPHGLGWDDWWEFAGGTLIVCGVIYLLIALAVFVSKWVWRGRDV